MSQQPASQLSRYRQLPGRTWDIVVKAVLVAVSITCLGYVIDVPGLLRLSFFKEQAFGLIYITIFVAAFILFPATKKATRNKLPWYDVVLCFLSMIGGGYIFLFYPSIATTLAEITPIKIMLGAITVLLVLELTRRIYGWTLVIITAAFILYAKFTWIIPGMLGGAGSSWQRVATYLYLDTNSMLGIIAAVIFGIIFAYVFFGRALVSTGGAGFFTDAALSVMGRFRGGSAKVTVGASSLFGAVSSSTLAVVGIVGPITIPQMREAGYKPHEAGAIVAESGNGGQIMPPILGSTAFILAEFTEIPYREIAIAAIIPALLYYLVTFIQIDLMAVKGGMKGLPSHLIPPLKKVFSSGWVFIIPMIVLVYCLFIIYLSPARSALYALASIIVVSMFRKTTRMTPRRFLESITDTGMLLIEIGVVGAVAGIVVGAVNLTGLGFIFSQALVELAGGNLLLMLLITAIASIILGMGLPVVTAYILLAILAAPALIQVGVPLLAAHFFIFYFAIASFITPPIMYAIFMASTLAGSGLMQTAFCAMRLAVVAYIIPFIFVLAPALLLQGSVTEIVLITIPTTLGFVFLAIAFEGYLFRRLALPVRLLLAIGAIGLLIPNIWLANIIGFVLAIVVLLWEWRARRALKQTDKGALS